MVSSPSKEYKSARSGLKTDHFQENLGSEVRGVKEGTVGDSVLQVSDLPNRITGSKTRSMSMGALSELGRYNSQPQQQPSPAKQLPAEDFLESPKDKIDVFELQGVPGMSPRSDSLARTNARDEHVLEGIETKPEAGAAPAEVSSTICSIPAGQVTEQEETCTPERLINSDKAEPLPGDTLQYRDDVSETDHVDDVMLEFREAVTALPPSFGVFLQDVKRSPATISDNLDELQKTSSAKDSSGDWSDGGHRRIERVVPEETLRNTPEFEDDEDTDLAPLPFSGPISVVGYSGPISAAPGFSGPISAAPGYSGPIYSNAGSISRRSDSCNTSARSFAFPILPGHEWNASPARMPPPDRSWKKKKSWRAWLCCSTPSTLP